MGSRNHTYVITAPVSFPAVTHARTWWSVKREREPVEAQYTHGSMGCSLYQYVINETLTGSSRAA